MFKDFLKDVSLAFKNGGEDVGNDITQTCDNCGAEIKGKSRCKELTCSYCGAKNINKSYVDPQGNKQNSNKKDENNEEVFTDTVTSYEDKSFTGFNQFNNKNYKK